MKRLIFTLAIFLLLGSQVSAQQIYEIQVTNPCTGELETFSASIDDRNGTLYAIYTYFGQTREFNTDDPNWINDATNWLIQLIEQQAGCGTATGVSSSVDPNVNPTMNTAISNLQNNLFTMDFTPPSSGGKLGSEEEEKEETNAAVQQQEVSLSGGASSYSYKNYSGTASNLGFDYISLLSVGQTQVGLNINSFTLGGNNSGGSTSTLVGLQFKSRNFETGSERIKEKTMSFNILGGQTSDGGGSFIYNSANKVKNQNAMTNSGIALSASFQSFNENSVVVFNTGIAYGLMRGWYFNEKFAGSINGLLIGSFGVHNVVTEANEQNDVSILGGASLGAAFHAFLFEGGGLKASINYNPSSYIYTYTENIPDDPYTDNYSNETSGFTGASSIGFTIGFSYRF